MAVPIMSDTAATMTEELKDALARAGWKSGSFRGFLRTSRAGIEFQVGPARASRRAAEPDAETGLELRYHYKTEQTEADGEVDLPAHSDLAKIEDAMTSIYLRVHDKPDANRVFGNGRRSSSGAARAVSGPSAAAPTPSVYTSAPSADPKAEAEEAGQGAFDL